MTLAAKRDLFITELDNTMGEVRNKMEGMTDHGLKQVLAPGLSNRNKEWDEASNLTLQLKRVPMLELMVGKLKEGAMTTDIEVGKDEIREDMKAVVERLESLLGVAEVGMGAVAAVAAAEKGFSTALHDWRVAHAAALAAL